MLALVAAPLLAACAGHAGPETLGEAMSIGGAAPVAAASAPARPAPQAVRTPEEVRRIEAEILTAAERQRAAAGGKPRSIVEEMRAAGRDRPAAVRRAIETPPRP